METQMQVNPIQNKWERKDGVKEPFFQKDTNQKILAIDPMTDSKSGSLREIDILFFLSLQCCCSPQVHI